MNGKEKKTVPHVTLSLCLIVRPLSQQV